MNLVSRCFIRTSLFLLTMVGWALEAAPAFAQTGQPVLVQVIGQVHSPLVLSKQDLLALPRKDYAEKRSVVQDGKAVTLTVRYQGVPLRQLLDLAGLKPDRHAVRRSVVLLTAHDGYQATFSWGEIYNSALGDGVVLVLREGDDELLNTDGFPSLRSLQDLRSGPRHVRWLETVEVLLPVGR